MRDQLMSREQVDSLYSFRYQCNSRRAEVTESRGFRSNMSLAATDALDTFLAFILVPSYTAE